jgi:hypothetical protein
LAFHSYGNPLAEEVVGDEDTPEKVEPDGPFQAGRLPRPNVDVGLRFRVEMERSTAAMRSARAVRPLAAVDSMAHIQDDFPDMLMSREDDTELESAGHCENPDTRVQVQARVQNDVRPGGDAVRKVAGLSWSWDKTEHRKKEWMPSESEEEQLKDEALNRAAVQMQVQDPSEWMVEQK